MQNQVFEGVKILDFTQVISGSYATTIMGDMGAEVVKVEPPVHGDTLRFAGPMYKGESGFFLLNNRNKKSISVNLKVPEGLTLVKELIPHFDVITQNFKPGVMDKLGLGYDEVKKLREDIIYVSVSGYGYNNKYSNRPAYDNIIQSETGLAAQNGMPDIGTPLRCPLSISDYVAGIYSALSMATALYHRKNTGKGQSIDIAMYDALISIMDNSFLMCDLMKDQIAEGGPDKKEENLKKMGLRSSGNRHAGAAPHGFYKTSDGYFAHMSLTKEMWHKLLEIIGRSDLIGNPKYEELDNRKLLWREIDGIVEEWSSKHTTNEVIRIFEENRLPIGKVRTVDEVYEDPHSKERGIFQEVEHTVAGKMRITNIPIKFSETPTQIRKSSPLLGEHNYEIFSGLLKYPKERVDELLEKKILYQEERVGS